MNPSDLVQLMRLSSTKKVRLYLEELFEKSKKSQYYAELYEELERMFLDCKRG